MAALVIRTNYDPPPIPLRAFDWSAADADNYEGGDPIGYGRTEQEAVDNLKLEIEERAV